jgi:hypothetical protein
MTFGPRITFLSSCLLGNMLCILDAGQISTQSPISAFIPTDPAACRGNAFTPLGPQKSRSASINTSNQKTYLPLASRSIVGEVYARRKASAEFVALQEPQEKSIATRKTKNTKLIEEFALRAAILLRESGGRMSSELFQTRWKCTFPRDDLAKYKQGLSLKKLLSRCGDNFLVEEMPRGTGPNPR